MAQAKGLAKLLKMKVGFITSQKDELHGVLDKYVTKMTDKARETLETEEQNVNTLKEINSAMDAVLEYLVHITSQMDDGTPTVLTEPEDQSSTLSLLSSFLPQPSPSIQQEKPQGSESEQVSKLQHRMEVLEMALTTCRTEISQVHTDKNEVTEKLDKLENLTQQTQSNMTKEIKDLQKTFKDNIKRTKQELDTKMDSIDEEFQKTQEQNLATIKEQASKLSKVEKNLKKMKEEERERWSQIDSIHKDVETLKDAATDEQVQELIQTTTATSRSLEELTSRVEDTERSVRGCVAQRERDENRRREMEDRVAVLETQRQKDLDHYTKELEETNSLYKAVCQLVDQRVTPLRRLQRMLNDYHKQVEKREEISTRLDDVVKKVEDISTQLDKLERSVVPVRVGFTAFYPNSLRKLVPSAGSHITDFIDVLCNEGNHYNKSTGEFICPIDGLYLVSATLLQFEYGAVNVRIKRECGNSATPPTVVCKVFTGQDNTSSCGVGVVRLKTGDRVYVEVDFTVGNPTLSHYSSFSCVLIA